MTLWWRSQSQKKACCRYTGNRGRYRDRRDWSYEHFNDLLVLITAHNLIIDGVKIGENGRRPQRILNTAAHLHQLSQSIRTHLHLRHSHTLHRQSYLQYHHQLAVHSFQRQVTARPLDRGEWFISRGKAGGRRWGIRYRLKIGKQRCGKAELKRNEIFGQCQIFSQR